MGSYYSREQDKKEILTNNLIMAIDRGDYDTFENILKTRDFVMTPYIRETYTVHHLFVIKTLQYNNTQVNKFCDIFFKYKNKLPLLSTPIQQYNSLVFHIPERKAQFTVDTKNEPNTHNIQGKTPIELAKLMKEIVTDDDDHYRMFIDKIINTFHLCTNSSHISFEPIEEVDNKYTELKNQSPDDTICKICYANENKVIFNPCGHMGSCKTCSVKVNICPFCRATIESRINVIAV